MGYGSQILHMVLFIIFMLISFHFTHILFSTATLNAATFLNIQENHHIRKGLILEKFRNLLALKKSFNIRKEPDFGHGSPSPAPAPAPTAAPAPAPVVPRRVHHHHRPWHRPLVTAPIHKEERGNSGSRRTLVAVVVSASAIFVLCGLGLVWGCTKLRKRRRKSASTVSIVQHSTEGGGTRGKSKYVVNSQNSVKKVTSDPGPDLFYLESIGAALESQPFPINASSNQNSSYWKLSTVEESDKELGKSDSDNAGSSVLGEIVSVNETEDSIKYEPLGCSSQISDEVLIPKEAHSSDDDVSFHSLCNSSNARLSDASAGTLSDTSEILSPNVSNAPDSLSYPPPPPPPPPPLTRTHISLSHSTTCSTRMASMASSSSTLPILSPPRNSDSSSGSNQTPQSDLTSSLPNPPKGTSGIPPPPCPPPFTKGNGNSLKGPPPPPSQLPQRTPLGKDGVPLPKLKPLHWDKVRAASDHSMVWDKLKSSSFEFDEEMIESLFGYNLKNTLKNDDAKSKSPSPSKHVLEPKRLQNITILSKALNVTADQVCDALMQGVGLCLQQLEALIKMEPTKEEGAKLASYKGDVNELGSAERFVMAMLNIPYAFQRIDAMLYRETFEDEVVHLRKSFSMLEEACKELRSSRLFLKLLEAVLKTGNRMNVGTIRGGAKAFKLDALLKLADVKGTDGKTTLLHFVVQEIIRAEGIKVSESIIGKINQKNKSIKNVEDREEAYRNMGLDLVSGLTTELFNVKKTATIDLDVIASSVSNLSDGKNKLQHLVNKDLSKEEKSGNFVQTMRSFLNYAEKNLKELQEDEHRVLLHVREIAEYFHGNVSKDEANPLRIFVIVRDFLGMLDHVCKELRSLKVSTTPNPLAPFR